MTTALVCWFKPNPASRLRLMCVFVANNKFYSCPSQVELLIVDVKVLKSHSFLIIQGKNTALKLMLTIHLWDPTCFNYKPQYVQLDFRMYMLYFQHITVIYHFPISAPLYNLMPSQVIFRNRMCVHFTMKWPRDNVEFFNNLKISVGLK